MGSFQLGLIGLIVLAAVPGILLMLWVIHRVLSERRRDRQAHLSDTPPVSPGDGPQR